jgi:hypothetical protein
VIYLALAGPWLALGFLLVIQRLERWLDDSVWGGVPAAPRNELPRSRRMDSRTWSSTPGARSVSRSP